MDFVKIADFNNKMQAATIAHILDSESIPYVIKSDEALLGEGGVTDDVSLEVPADKVQRAKALIEGTTNELDV